MIATLKGVVSEKLGDVLVLDVRGVGYGLLVSHDDVARAATGDELKLYVHEHIREDAHDLFGFSKLSARQLFAQLISVTGVGPKMALSIMNVGNEQDVKSAIARGDTKWLSQATGVGKRVAERVVVDLKDKVGLASSDAATSFLQEPGAGAMSNDEAAQALMALGFTAQDAALALKSIDATLPTEERVRQALKGSAL